MLVSFIIPHKGREELLLETLDSISELDFDLDQVEVLVMSQNPTAINTQAYKNKLKHLKTQLCASNKTISYLRNKGVTTSQGQYLAFIDADVALAPNWLNAMLNQLQQNPKCVLTSAIQQCDPKAPILEKIRTQLSNAVIDTTVRFLPGRNLFLHRDTFNQTEGFPEHLITCEDYYFTDKVSQLGELFYSAASHYIHLGEDKKYPEMFKKEIWRGRSNLESLQGRRIPLAEYPSILLPIAIALCAFVTLVGLLTLSAPIIIFGLTGLLLPILVYSLRLYMISEKTLPLSAIVYFYLLYFPARAIGTLKGLPPLLRAKQ